MKNKLYNILCNKILRLLVDSILLISASYFTFKKAADFSLTGWLVNNAFHQPLVNFFVCLFLIVIFLSIILKIFFIYMEYFPRGNHDRVDPDSISKCMAKVNGDIFDRIQKSGNSGFKDVFALFDNQSFKTNLEYIIEAMAEHIRKSITSVRIKSKDLFISLYLLDKDAGLLEYMMHYDSKRDLVASRRITFSDKNFSDYECVKCINSDRTTACVINKSEYKKGASKRYKTITHYLGSKISSGDKVYAFLNIEFHNHSIFSDEIEMDEFLEEYVHPFKLLIEYQFLKNDFFKCVRGYKS